MKCLKIIVIMFMSVMFLSEAAYARSPLTADSRIRTFVFNENEVFKLVTEFGYQSNIELTEDESIITMSVGDAVSFKITPSGSRIFVKALRNNSHTNMTLVTTKRTYQFELSSELSPAGTGHEIIYVMRFYYPSAVDDVVTSTVGPASMARRSMGRPVSGAISDVVINQVSADAMIGNAGVMPSQFTGRAAGTKNMDYSMSGDKAISPVMLYDDGRSTYFKFSSDVQFVPTIYIVNADGTETSVPVRNEGGLVVLSGVYSKLALRSGPAVTCIFNGKMDSLTVAVR